MSHQPARVPGYEDEGDYELPLQNSTSALDADLGHAITLNDVLTQLPRTGARYSYPSQPRLALDYAVGTGQGFHSTGIHSDPVDYYSSYELPDGFGAKQVGNVPPGLDSAILCPSEQPDHPEDFALIAQRSSAPNSGCSGLNQSNHSARIKRKVNAALGSVRDLVVPKVARLEAYGSTTSNEVNPRSYGGSIQTLARQIDKEAFSAEVHAQSATPPHPTATRSSPKVKPLIEKKIKDTMKRKRHFVDEGKDEERLGKVARGHSDLLGRPSKTHYNRVHSKSTHQSAPLLAATTYAAFRRRDPHLEIASPTPSDIIATANAEGDLLSVNSVQPEPVPESNKPFVIGTPRHSRTKRFTTPTQLARPPVDGADSGRRTVRHYNPSVSDQELDFWACRNEPRVKWEVDAYPATNDHESLQFGPALPYEAFMPETVQTTVDDADQTGHNLESDYIAFLPASWYDETSEITDASIIKPEDEPALDPTLSGSTTPNVAMSEWMNADFEF